MTLIDGATGSVNGLPLLTTCTLAETNKPATTDASYVWGTEVWTPSSSLTIVANDADNTVGVVLTNPLVRVEGGFTVTKHVTGETGGYVAGTTFPVDYSCSNGASGTLHLTDGATGAVTGLPLLTTCTLSAGAAATKDASYAWGTETWTPSNTVTIVKNDASNVVGVVLSNPIHRVLGGFAVTKHVTGETAGYVAGSTFTVATPARTARPGRDPEGRPDQGPDRPAAADHLHPVRDHQAGHHRRQLRVGHARRGIRPTR